MFYLSPAKLNLFFRVLRKRPDGYHEIASLFQAIDLFDTLSLEKGDSDALTCSDPTLACDGSNLVVKALHLFRARFPFPFGMKIHLEKKIPIQAGLGGGSGNAATTLWGLNELTGRPASLQQLIEIGTLLGSDVPFFFSSGTAYCTGRGEIFEPFLLPKALRGWLAKPPFGLSTPLVYKETRVSELPQRDPRDALHGYPLFYNDLEPAAFRLEPRLLPLKRQFETMGFDSVTMTGSGTAFFCVGQNVSAVAGIDAELIPFQPLNRSSSSWY